MEKEMTGADRRKEILSMIRDTDTPVSGTAIGRKTGVSRQVVVQDIALLPDKVQRPKCDRFVCHLQPSRHQFVKRV
jgi:hypothetical protein